MTKEEKYQTIVPQIQALMAGGTERSLRSLTSIVPTSIPSMKSTECTSSNYLTISYNLSNPLFFPKIQ